MKSTHETPPGAQSPGPPPGNPSVGNREKDEYGNPIDGKPFDVDKDQQAKTGKQDVKSQS